jgi:hypothetical protein
MRGSEVTSIASTVLGIGGGREEVRVIFVLLLIAKCLFCILDRTFFRVNEETNKCSNPSM